jgi:hypothetical protein
VNQGHLGTVGPGPPDHGARGPDLSALWLGFHAVSRR